MNLVTYGPEFVFQEWDPQLLFVNLRAHMECHSCGVSMGDASIAFTLASVQVCACLYSEFSSWTCVNMEGDKLTGQPQSFSSSYLGKNN